MYAIDNLRAFPLFVTRVGFMNVRNLGCQLKIVISITVHAICYEIYLRRYLDRNK